MLTLLASLFGLIGTMALGGSSSKEAVDAIKRDLPENDADTKSAAPVVVSIPPVQIVASPEPREQAVLERPDQSNIPGNPNANETAAEDPGQAAPAAPAEPAPNPTPAPAPNPPQMAKNEGPDGLAPQPVLNVGAPVSVMAGRVHTLQIETSEPIASIKILSDPAHGNVTVNPDNSLAVVLTGTDETGQMSFDYRVSYADGSQDTQTMRLDVVPGEQAAGWATGANHYMLETDAAGDLVIETGDNHREVYVSASEDALTLADIAALEGLDVPDITRDWLRVHTDYGSEPEMALAQDAGSLLWTEITDRSATPNSHWLLFERGYEYHDFGRLVPRGATGEDELHPIHITSYGEGAKPVLPSAIIYQNTTENLVISDLHFEDGFTSLSGTNIILEDTILNGELNLQGYFSDEATFTLYDSAIYDAALDAPRNGSTWTGGDREQGLFVASMEGLLVKDSLFDHNGWGAGYSEDMDGDSPQPINMFNHNIYVQNDNVDVTFTDNITSRASSIGLQLRSGGFVEDNVILDNNVAFNTLGGDYKGAGPIGNYTLMTGNLITSAGYREADVAQGAVWWGLDNSGQLSTLHENILTHLADPNNPEEQAAKPDGHWALQSGHEAFFDDTIIYNWVGSSRPELRDKLDKNIEGLDRALLDQTTIQNYAAQLLGQSTATIDDLASFLRLQELELSDTDVTADDIIAYFQASFGILDDTRTQATELRFIPNALGDGVRWDNRLNWSTDDLPGAVEGDSVDLGGNWVQYAGTNTLQGLDLGDGGKLSVTHGRLNVEGITQAGEEGGRFEISDAGQVWINGYSDTDTLEVSVDGGRFANTGQLSGNVSLTVEDGNAILATHGAVASLTDGAALHIIGDEADVGFDGTGGGSAALEVGQGGVLSFKAQNGEINTIEEFRSGAFGDDSDVRSTVDLQNGTLQISLDAAINAGNHTLIDVDEITGVLDYINIDGLNDTRDASITVDYTAGKLFLSLSEGGTGAVHLQEIHADANAQNADTTALFTEAGTELLETPDDISSLWEALTAEMDILSETPPSMELDDMMDNDLVF
jgi:hypothetical protein